MAARRIATRITAGELTVDDITPERLDDEIGLADLPPPDLCIRTGGDHRVSNFMLWQFAYTELYFTETLWPDFGARELTLALEDFSGRERRFGLRGYEIDLDNLDEADSTTDSFYRAEVLTIGEFRFAMASYGVPFHTSMGR